MFNLKKIFWVLVLILCSCASTKKVPVIVDGNSFVDNNPPSISIVFPFEIESHDQKSGFEGESRYTRHVFKAKDENVFALVSKERLAFFNYYYDGADSAKINNKVYLESKSTGFCSVSIDRYEETDFFIGTINKYSGARGVVSILLLEDTGYSTFSLEELKELPAFLPFLENTKNLCGQVFADK